MYKIPANALDAEVDLNGKTARIVGLKPFAPKNKVVIEESGNQKRQMVASVLCTKMILQKAGIDAA